MLLYTFLHITDTSTVKLIKSSNNYVTTYCRKWYTRNNTRPHFTVMQLSFDASWYTLPTDNIYKYSARDTYVDY
jgi:hypothetical protein